MGIISETLDVIKEVLRFSRNNWDKLNEHQIPSWLLKRAKKRYNSMKDPIGNRSHFIGKTFFYKVWYKGKKDWVFYRKKK